MFLPKRCFLLSDHMSGWQWQLGQLVFGTFARLGFPLRHHFPIDISWRFWRFSIWIYPLVHPQSNWTQLVVGSGILGSLFFLVEIRIPTPKHQTPHRKKTTPFRSGRFHRIQPSPPNHHYQCFNKSCFNPPKDPHFPQAIPTNRPGAAAAREDDAPTVRLGSCRILATALRHSVGTAMGNVAEVGFRVARMPYQLDKRCLPGGFIFTPTCRNDPIWQLFLEWVETTN